jgi:hypothetical protein
VAVAPTATNRLAKRIGRSGPARDGRSIPWF